MDYFSALSAVSAAAAAGVAIWVVVYGGKQRRFQILEDSFDVLQRINEAALASEANALAAIRSANPADQATPEEARIIYFHYMRINRIFRAYEYWRGGFLSEKERERVIAPQLRTLVSIQESLPAIVERGYPDDFLDFLIPAVRSASESRPIDRLHR